MIAAVRATKDTASAAGRQTNPVRQWRQPMSDGLEFRGGDVLIVWRGA
jgi:hypothetical protein